MQLTVPERENATDRREKSPLLVGSLPECI